MRFVSYNSYNFICQFTVVIITSLTLCCVYASKGDVLREPSPYSVRERGFQQWGKCFNVTKLVL